VPRRINALCDRSLLAAYARGSHEVRPGHVKQAKRELEGRLPAGAQEEPTRKTHPATAAAAFLLAAGLVFLVYWTYIKDYGVWP
jgi:general secretion pathway protein A